MQSTRRISVLRRVIRLLIGSKGALLGRSCWTKVIASHLCIWSRKGWWKVVSVANMTGLRFVGERDYFLELVRK